jgi:hypothetical protein
MVGFTFGRGPSALRRRFAAIVGVAAIAASIVPTGVVSAKSPNSGFLTSAPPMLKPLVRGVTVKPIITVGDHVGSYRFEAIPDGIAIDPRGGDRLDIYVNHETSTVPFPLPPAGLADFDNAQLSHLVLKAGSAKVLSGSLVIDSSSNYQRFCSNFFAGAAQGFSRNLVLTNEETSDFVNRTGTAWPPGPGAEQAGVVVAYDPATGLHRSIYGMGRMNHENAVAIPGFGKAVLVTGDDTFAAPSSQLYMYLANNADDVWNDQGHLWAFKSDDAAVNDYGDLSGSQSVSGRFIEVPDDIADGNQTGLETWSNANNVFQFIRIEDLAYDRNHTNVVYFADTGEPRAIADAVTGRLKRGPSGTTGPYSNGRVFKVVLDPTDPTVVSSLSILINGDTAGYGSVGTLHQPDNLETTASSILVTEDPGGHNRFAGSTNARLWKYDLASGAFAPVAVVSAATADWESSGVVDASQYFGDGAFLIDVQAHTIFVDQATSGGITYKREGGQLLLIRIPGA